MHYIEYTEELRQDLIAKGYNYLQPGLRIPAGLLDDEPGEEAPFEMVPLYDYMKATADCFPIDSDEALQATDMAMVQFYIKLPA